MKSHLLKITFCALVLAAAGIVRADQAADAAAKPAEASAATPAPAAAPEPSKDWSVAVGMDLYSEYIFRGVDILNNREVWVPSVIAKYKGFTASYFGYFGDVSVPSTVGQWYEETDLSIDYTQTLFDGKLALTGGALWYIYNDGGSGVDTVELYGKTTWNDGILNPYAALNWDIDEFHGGYLALGVSHTFDLSKQLKLKDGMSLAIVPMAQLGLDFGNISRKTQSNADWNDLLFGVSVPFGITPALNIHVGIQMSVALNSVNNLYNTTGSSKGNEVIGNVGVGYSF